jgi:V/A-type H+-transporting ATPase subunit I
MVKYDVLVYRNDIDVFLNALQDMGASHVETGETKFDTETTVLLKKAEKYQTIYNALKAIEIENAGEVETIDADPKTLVEMYENAVEKRSNIDAAIKKIEKDIEEARPWDEFDRHDIEKLKQLNLIPHFYSVNEKYFDKNLSQNQLVCEMNRYEGRVYFAVIQEDGRELDFDLPETKLPAASYIELSDELKRLENDDSKCRKIIAGIAIVADTIEAERKKILEKADFGMAKQSASDAADGYVKRLTIWAPRMSRATIEVFLDRHPVIWIDEVRVADEQPPIMLRNNNFAKLFEPITKLYSLPNYREIDLTPMLAPFFMLFFGFCLGDGGYGLFILTLASILKLKIKSESIRPFLSLAQWLGGGTMLFGFITATFFGITFNDIKPDKIIEQRLGLQENYGMLFFSLILGCVQIIAGMCINVANIVIIRGWKYAMANIAWIVMVLGGAACYFAGDQMGRAVYALYGLLAAAALTALLYNSPGKNPAANIGAGLWTAYNTVSGLLGDLLSYIRLFALGMTGGILGGVFNTIALDAGQSVGLPVVDVLVTIVILLFGHGLNITLNMLGAFVHPMRLTFVEFYKNAGFSGGGRPFKYFAKAGSK